MDSLALSWPGPFEAIWLIVILLLVIGLPIFVLTAALRLSRSKRQQQAFPVLPGEPDGPGTYRIVGLDKTSRADREITIEAASRANAHVKAELDGIIVTSVSRV